MTDYTPTTEEVVQKYATEATWQGQSFTAAEAEFNRWLDARDAEKRAEWEAEGAEEPEIEYRIDDGKTLSYSRSKSRADRALTKGHRVWRRTPERRASSWLPVELEDNQTTNHEIRSQA